MNSEKIQWSNPIERRKEDTINPEWIQTISGRMIKPGDKARS